MIAVYRITAPLFVAGVVIHEEHVVLAAPVLYYMDGWTFNHVRRYCEVHGWSLERVEPCQA